MNGNGRGGSGLWRPGGLCSALQFRAVSLPLPLLLTLSLALKRLLLFLRLLDLPPPRPPRLQAGGQLRPRAPRLWLYCFSSVAFARPCIRLFMSACSAGVISAHTPRRFFSSPLSFFTGPSS